MGETDGEQPATDARESAEPEASAAGQDTLQVPTQKRRRIKSPTPGSIRGRSATPIRGRSRTPFDLYITRRSATPMTYRSITPFLKREDREKTPFELGRDIRTQLICNSSVFDKALVMDITEPEVPAVRYITSDLSVIDRAAVMDISNVEVIYVVEEYDENEEYTEEEEIVVEEKPKKKAKGKKARTPRKSVEKEGSETSEIEDFSEDREDSVDLDAEPVKKGKKKAPPKKKEKKEKSPSPKISLSLELGGGAKANKKLFDQPSGPARPPPKKSALVLKMEEQAKAAAKAAEEEAQKQAGKPKGETFDERQKRLKEEAEEQARLDEEQRLLEEEAAEEGGEEGGDDEDGDDGGEEGEDDDDASKYDEDGSRYGDDASQYEDEDQDKFEEAPVAPKRRGSDDSDEGFTRPDDDERWQKIAEQEGEEFMQQMRKFSRAKALSEKERDADWQKHRENARRPAFINYLTDRTAEVGHNVRLACAVYGSDLSVKWYKDGRQLERDATHRIANNNNILSLEIVNTVSTDSGEYSCSIANMNDEVTSSCIVTIYEVFKDEPTPPAFSLIRDFYHLHDDELTIECHVHGVPRPKITWINGGIEIKPSYKFTLLEEAHGVYKLLIYRPSNRDAGKYVCRAINSSGESEIAHVIEVAKNKNFHVRGIFHARDRIQRDKENVAKRQMEEAMKSKEDSDIKRAASVEPRRYRSSPEPLVAPKNKLKFATQLRDRMALEGHTIKLFCNVLGPSPGCRWFKDDKPLQAGPTVRNLSEEGKAVIELVKVTAECSGVYKCVAKNEFNEIDTSCYLKIYSPQAEGDEQEPMFALPLRDVYHSSENDLIIETKIRGNPRPTIEWLKDEVPVVLDARIQQIEHLDGVCELIINKPTLNDNGNYACVATNSLGSQKNVHSVVVDVPASRRSSNTASMQSAEEKESAIVDGEDKEAKKSKKKASPPPEGDGTYERRSRMPDPSPKNKLYFIANMSNRYLAEGAKVKMQAVIGGPDPQIRWLKDGQNVTYGPRIRNLNRDSLAVLEIQNATEEDSGNYTIVARNEWCEITTTALLHVYQPKVSTDVAPTFTRSIKESYHLNTNELVLESHVRGQPAPTVTWFKDSVEIEKSAKYQIIDHPDGTTELIVDKPDNKDSGKYQIKAESRAGKADITHNVVFIGKATHIAENIHGVFHADKNLLRKEKKEEEAPVESAAESEGGDGEKKGKGKGKKKSDDEEPIEEAVVVSDAPTKEPKREKRIGIHFTAKLTDRVVVEGSKVKLACCVEGNEPVVKWIHDDQPIAFSPKSKMNFREGLCTLELVSVTEAESGEYKCFAKDVNGEVTSTCKLTVYANPGSADVPPTFTRAIKDTYHGKINELVLDVHVRGLPTATVSWVKDGVRIEPNDKYQQIDHEDGTCELFISDPLPIDSGKYVCQAENRADKAEIVHLVQVEARNVRQGSPVRQRSPVQKPAEKKEETDEEKAEREERRKKKKEEEEQESSGRREVPPPPDLKKKIYICNSLANRTVPEGVNVKWTVYVDGPEPTAKWFHDDKPIAFGPHTKLSFQDGLAILNIVNVTEEDSGAYKLYVRGLENEAESTCNLLVYKIGKVEATAPVFTVGIKDSYVSHSHQIVLECNLSGHPAPTISWQKDNVLLSLQSDKYIFNELAEGVKQLIIVNPEESDTALYTCYAENSDGNMRVSKFLDTSKHLKKAITAKKYATSAGVAVGHDTNGYQGEKSQRRLSAVELRNSLLMRSGLKDIVTQTMNKVQLACSLQGLIESVRWLKDDESVIPSGRHKMYNISGAISLEIFDPIPEDSGIYTCIVKNSHNEIETRSHLQIFSKFDASANLLETFTSPIKATYDANRGQILLECAVKGRPTVVWLKDDRPISNNRYRPMYKPGGVHQLFIRNPVSKDFGMFACQTEHENRLEVISVRISQADFNNSMLSSDNFLHADENGRHSKVSSREGSFLRDSNRKPIFSTLLHDRTISEHSCIRLICNVLSGCETEVVWMKNNKPMEPSARYQAQFSSGLATLEIFSTTLDDAGNYACVAKNSYGEVFTYCQLKVYKGYDAMSQPPTFTRFIKDTYYLNEDELVLDCRVRGNPRPEIQWSIGNDLIYNDDKYQQLDQADGYCKLIISNPTEKDSGVYSCKATNEAQAEKITHTVDFVGKDKFIFQKTHGFFHRDPNKPHFANPLGNHIVTPGGTIALSAEFAPTSTPIEVQWFRDKVPLAGQPNVTTFYDRGIYTLAIQQVQGECEGTYTCRASNAFGKVESNSNIHLATTEDKADKPPLFLSRPDTEMKIAVNDPFSISFRVQGEPKPKLTLLKGTKDVTKSDRVSKEASDDYIRFTVHKAQVKDSGTYFVIARNEFGTDRIFVTITVVGRARSITPSLGRWGQPIDSYPDTSYFKDPPGPISTEPVISDAGRNHISLSWGKPYSLNSAPVIAYRVDAWMVGREGGAVWKELGMTPIPSFDAFNLRAGCEYHFRVTPKNRYGWGPAVQTRSPVLIGGVDCLPEFVKILSGQCKSLQNEECVLDCVVRGTPKPVIQWYKDGVPIHSQGDHIVIRQIGFNCKLIIGRVTGADSGRYSCEATNSKGRVSTFARLQVVTDPKIYAADCKLKRFAQSELDVADESLPMFTMRLRDRRIQVTYPVRLTCQVVGYPRPLISWSKDGKSLGASERFIVSDDGQFNTLEICSASLDDNGRYTAMAQNDHGSVSCHCSLVVDKGIRAYISPDFYVPLEPVYTFREGQEIRLTTKVEAYPSVGVSWNRNGCRLRPSRNIGVTLDYNGFIELTIKEASHRDAGIYVCIAANAVGRAETNCKVVVEGCENGSIATIPLITGATELPYSKEPIFIKKPRSSEAYEGDTVIILCEVVADPKPDVIWLRDFLKPEYYKDAPQFRRIGDGPEYRLEIPSAKLDFTGTYSVIAKNCHGETKAIISLQIYAKDMSKVNTMEKGAIRHGNVESLPMILRRLKDLKCCDGDSITLECHVEGVPKPMILWEKDGHILHSGKDFNMAYDGVRAALSINRVYPEDEGEYTCVAKNNIGQTFTSGCVIVDVPEEKENLLSEHLARPMGLLSANSTPRSTPRSTPIRSVSPMRRSYRNTSVEYIANRYKYAAPKFLAIPQNKVAEEGETVRFQCVISGLPTPWSTWDKDGLIVTPTTRITVSERDDLRFLEIDQVTFDDAGLYRITLENDYGRIEATARLDVIGNGRSSQSRTTRVVHSSPSRNFYMSRRIAGQTTIIGGRLALSAGFRGSSVPARKFYHNGEEVVASERIQISITDAETALIIDNAQLEDEGIYTCVAQADDELITTSTSVVLYDDVESILEELPTIVQQLAPNVDAIEGESVDLVFEIDCAEPYNWEWTKDGHRLANSDEFRYIDHGNGMLTLRILDAFAEDSGCYECTISTANGICQTSCSLTVKFNDFSPAPETNLTFLKRPLPTIGVVGDIVSLVAKVNPPNAGTKWTIGGRQIASDSRDHSLEESHSDGIRVLHILGLDYKHSGETKITIEHPSEKSTLTSYAYLGVFPRVNITSPALGIEEVQHDDNEVVPATITEGPKDCTAFIGGSVLLHVSYIGYPSVAVRWLKAGRPIFENSNIKILTTPTQSVLQLTAITADESGKYTVDIMNDYGSDMAVASVAVEGPPEAPSGKPCVSQGPDRVAVAWCGPPYDGGCMLTGFIIEMQTGDSDWIEIITLANSLAYTVTNLKPGVSYRFRVCAENIHGRSPPSLASDEVVIVHEDLNKDFTDNRIAIRAGGDFKARFETLEELGKGRFGVVYKVQDKETDQILAAKIIKCIKSRDRQKVQEEISIMKSLRHLKLLQLAAAFETPREIIMVMEYITGGELFERVVADDFTLTERDCILFLRQICEGVDYMHDQSVVHLDLKPENIMCHTRTSHEIKIIDFGLAQRLNTNSPMRVLFGTPEFIPPEIINYEPISFKSDMWSVGVICYVLLSGLSPFMGDTDVDTFSNITRADYDFDDEAFDAVSQEAKDFISNLLVHRKEDRLTAKDCLESTWLTQHHDVSLNKNKICTDKLKKFIIRRKWQKTGNAIRALGRMANLSASRRNSAVSAAGSLPSSPRPSISGGLIFNPNVSTHMTSLNEEDDDFDSYSCGTDQKSLMKPPPKIRDKPQCSERSDSGFSECSTCSGGGNVQCLCPHAGAEKSQATSNELSVAVPHDILKTKLEQIALTRKLDKIGESDDDTSPGEKLVINETEATKVVSCSSLEDFTIEIPAEHRTKMATQQQMEEVPAEVGPKETIMRSDFTNTIKMRKKSLENNVSRERPKAKAAILEPSGKVSMLKTRFQKSSPVRTTSSGRLGAVSMSSKRSMEAGPQQSVFDRLACTQKNNARIGGFSTSLPGSPLPTRSGGSAMRLSGRVREATARLSQPKQTPPPPPPPNPISNSARKPPMTPPAKRNDYQTKLLTNSNKSHRNEWIL